MSDDLPKKHKPECELKDEDPTDQSPIPDFATGGDTPDAQVDAGHQPTQTKLTAIPGGRRNGETSQNDETRQALQESNEMLARQKQEISELRDAIASMSEEIKRLHTSISEQSQTAAPAPSTPEPVINPAPGAVNRLLVVISGGQRLKYPLFKDSMTIGRSPENDIQVATQFVSRVHARLTSDSRGATIEDLNSRNGVVVNSRKVSKKRLRNGDLIALGKVQFKFIDLMEDDSGEGQA